MPGWFFAYPLLGAWLDERAPPPSRCGAGRSSRAERWPPSAALVALQAATGFPLRLLPLRPGVADPTLEAFAWSGLRSAPLLDPPPAFVLSTHWSDAGKIALALGPDVPVFVISDDPRGWAYSPTAER